MVWVDSATAASLTPARRYASSADTSGRYYSDDDGATWDWEQFSTGGDADAGIGGSSPGYYATGDADMGYGGAGGGYSAPARQYAPSADPNGQYYSDDGGQTWQWEDFPQPQVTAGLGAAPGYNYPAQQQPSYQPPIDYGQVQPGDADMGIGGSVAQMPGFDFAQAYPSYGDADQDIGGSVANMPGYGYGDPEVAQWQGNPQWQQPSEFDVPLFDPRQQALDEILNPNDPYAEERPGGGFLGAAGRTMDRVSYPFDYMGEVGGSVMDAQFAALDQTRHGDPWGANKTSLGGFREAGGDIINPNEAVREFRDRPLYQQVGYGAVFDPTMLLGGAGAAPDVLRAARQAPDALRPVMRGLGNVGESFTSGRLAGELGGGSFGGADDAARRAAEEAFNREIVQPGAEAFQRVADENAGVRFTPENEARLGDESPDVTAAKRALIDALDKEANIRKVGTAAREIHEGRVAQAGGIRGQLDEGLAEGLSGQALVDKARSGAAVGTLRRTFADAPELTPEVRTALLDDVVRQFQAEEISPFDFLRGSKALGKVLDGDMNLLPSEAKVLREILGDEVVDRIIRAKNADPNALTRAQEARLAAQNTAREETLLARAEKAAGEAEARATRAAGTAQETLDRAAFRDKWRTISKRNDAEEIRTLLADRFMTPEERSIAIKAVTAATERAQKAASVATEAVWKRAAKADPEAETLRREAIAEISKKVDDPKLRDQMERTIAVWTDQNRVRLDGIKSSMPEIVNTITGSIRAGVTGQLKDSWLTAAAYRKADLVNALEAQGLETEFAKKVANAMFDRELKLKYPKGVPDDIAKQVQQTKGLPYGEPEGFSKLGGISQDMKNSAFGIDFGIMGQQVLHAFRYGGPNIMAGAVNELLAAVHLPSVRVFGNNLPREIEMLLDGVNVGAPTGISDFSRQSSMLSWLGKPGKALDQKVYLPVADKITDLQFRGVLGTVRRWNYEGNLMISKLAGADITNARVRANAGDYANANTSYGRLAVNTARREAERGAILTPSMTRAQINQILQVSKLLSPTAPKEQRILAAATIASWGASTLVIGKLLHDYAGVGDFEWDPSKPGYGNITLKNGYVINLYPQEQITKTLARSARILTDLNDSDWTALAKEWGKLGMGRSSPPLQVAEKSAGFGYQPERGYAFGDYGEGMTPIQRIMSQLPLPVGVSNYYHGGDLATTGAGLTGLQAYKESDYVAFNRDITQWAKENNVRDDQGKLITSWGDLDKGQKQAAEKAGLKAPEYSGPSDPVVDVAFKNYNATKDEAAGTLRKAIDSGAKGKKLRDAIGEFKDTVRIAGNTALRDAPEATPDSKRDAYGAMYWSAQAPEKADGTPDFDAMNAERARILAEAQAAGVDPAYITGKGENTYRGLRYTDPVIREAIFKLEDDREIIEESGYWELQDDFWHKLNATGAVPNYIPSSGYYEWKAAQQAAFEQRLINEAGMHPTKAKTEAAEHYASKAYNPEVYAITTKFDDMYKEQVLYPWADTHRDAFLKLVEWDYKNPDEALERLLDEILAGAQ